jgi:hypothetical protein
MAIPHGLQEHVILALDTKEFYVETKYRRPAEYQSLYTCLIKSTSPLLVSFGNNFGTRALK